jgi:uncharacterized protein YbjT (DUF2867 family)
MENRIALVVGASGLVGEHLTKLLVKSNSYSCIRILGRSQPTISHPSISYIPAQLTAPGLPRQAFVDVHDIFCCIGTTAKKTPDKAEYAAIDKGIPDQIAQIGKIFNVKKILVVSSIGASINSKFFYLKIKGEMEEKVIDSGIQVVEIFRPATLLGKRKEFRLGEWFSRTLDLVTRHFIPKKFRGIEAKNVAKAMVVRALDDCDDGVNVWENMQIDELSQLFKSSRS